MEKIAVLIESIRYTVWRWTGMRSLFGLLLENVISLPKCKGKNCILVYYSAFIDENGQGWSGSTLGHHDNNRRDRIQEKKMNLIIISILFSITDGNIN